MYATEHHFYKTLAKMSEHRYPYRNVSWAEITLKWLIDLLLDHRQTTDKGRLLKHYIVILFPQLDATTIKSCTVFASYVGYLTAGDELDELVLQAVPTYINVGIVVVFSLEFVVLIILQGVNDETTERFKTAWGLQSNPC